MTKDIYRWWSKKALKGEILKLKLTYNDLFDAMLRVQEENRELKKKIKIIDDANVNLRTNNEDMSKKELKEQLEVTESYINDIPMIIDPCRMCESIDANKETHVEHVDVCQECCWYYESMFKVAK